MILIKFPLYKDDKNPIEDISKERRLAVVEFEDKVKKGEYHYIENICLCANKDSAFDIVISEKDRYGISVKFLLCKKCSLLRSDKKLDSQSLADFYTYYYRRIYGDGLLSIENEFNGQVKKGNIYKRKLEKYIPLKEIETIYDFGCGAGGTLFPFLNKRTKVFGSDYDYDRLKYGKEKGLNLLHAIDDKQEIEDKKYDLLILSHVMEHFANPISELNKLFELITDDGYIVVVVPSSLYVGKSPHITCRFFQNVHLYNFNKVYLDGFFKALNMEVIYSDEESFCILKKPKNWIKNYLDFYSDVRLNGKYKEIVSNFQKVVILNDILKISTIKTHIVLFIIMITDKLGIKENIKRILGR